MAGSGTSTAQQLAFRAGVPLRTVRFYVQERLIDPPLARGRGANFTNHHLLQLQQARSLQNAGFSLEEIRERRGDLSLGLETMARFDALRRSWKSPRRPKSGATAVQLDVERCVRIPMSAGIELLVEKGRPLPAARALVQLSLQVRKTFGEP